MKIENMNSEHVYEAPKTNEIIVRTENIILGYGGGGETGEEDPEL